MNKKMFTPIQVAIIGIHFDHIKENRRAWQYCTVLNLLCVLSFVITIFNYMHIERRSTIHLMIFFSCGISYCGRLMQTTISFSILIRALYVRFAALNKFLRYLTWLRIFLHIELIVLLILFQIEINF